MVQAPPTRLHIDPPMDQWQVTPRNGRSKPVIATGHQPTLWHPGILVKDIAADMLAKRVGGSALHVVVEHNKVEPIGIDVPTQRGEALGTRRLAIEGRHSGSELPPNRLKPIVSSDVADQLNDAAEASDLPGTVAKGLREVAKAYLAAGDDGHLAKQTTAVLEHLKRPYLSAPMRVRSTDAIVTQGFIDRLLSDPVDCVRAYNRAAKAYPEARIRPLNVGRLAIEAPLWFQQDGRSHPVYIDVGDSRSPHLFSYASLMDLAGPDALQALRPRAITLSALMRSEHCDLFIHGTGGGVYDQVTERWWQDWTGEDLAPKAVASADVYLPFGVPIATASERQRAQWFAHHLPHNIDRFAEPQDNATAGLGREKRLLLDRMNDDRDRRRRAKAFARIYAINAELRRRHDVLVQSATRRSEDARVGVSNATIAGRRDWCFAFYPAEQLGLLKQEMATSLEGPDID